MSLSNFFRINMPYGLKINSAKEWIVFNREYMPLGWNSIDRQKSISGDDAFADMPVYTKYKGLTESLIKKLISNTDAIHTNVEGKITMFFLYNDATNPSVKPQHWDAYLDKIKTLSKLES